MASAELQIPEHIQETQNITREELEMILHTLESTGNGRTTKKSTTDRKSNL